MSHKFLRFDFALDTVSWLTFFEHYSSRPFLRLRILNSNFWNRQFQKLRNGKLGWANSFYRSGKIYFRFVYNSVPKNGQMPKFLVRVKVHNYCWLKNKKMTSYSIEDTGRSRLLYLGGKTWRTKKNWTDCR